MKKLITTLALALTGIYAFAQIPNASFENWSGGDPDNWTTDNNQNPNFVTQTNQSHTGSSAAKIGVATLSSTNVGGLLDGEFHVSTTSESDSLVFWYKTNFVASGDCVTAYLYMYNNTSVCAYGTALINVNASTYTRYAIGAFMLQAGAVDSVSIIFILGNGSSNSIDLNSYFILDDINIGGNSSSGIHEQQKAADISVFPNPSSSHINFSLDQKSTVELYSVDGSLLLSQQVDKGNVQLDLADLPEGMLLMVVRNENELFQQQIIHAR